MRLEPPRFPVLGFAQRRRVITSFASLLLVGVFVGHHFLSARARFLNHRASRFRTRPMSTQTGNALSQRLAQRPQRHPRPLPAPRAREAGASSASVAPRAAQRPRVPGGGMPRYLAVSEPVVSSGLASPPAYAPIATFRICLSACLMGPYPGVYVQTRARRETRRTGETVTHSEGPSVVLARQRPRPT